MFNFGDGAVAGLLVADTGRNEVLGSHALTNGAYSLQVKVAGGASTITSQRAGSGCGSGCSEPPEARKSSQARRASRWRPCAT